MSNNENIPLLIDENHSEKPKGFKRKRSEVNFRIDLNDKVIRPPSINIDLREYLVPAGVISGVIALIFMFIAIFAGIKDSPNYSIYAILTFIFCTITLIFHVISWITKEEKGWQSAIWLFNVAVWLYNVLSAL